MLPNIKPSNHYTTERPGWRPFFKENTGFGGETLHSVLTKAELDFRVIKVPTVYRLPGTDKEFYSRGFSTVREDNGQEFGVGFTGQLDNVGNLAEGGYTVVQHEDALNDIFNDVLKLESSATCVNAIGFDGGARVAISFRLPDEVMVKPGDNQKMYLNFFNSFDGKGGLGASWFTLRPVCINTYAMAKSSGINGYFTRHTKNVEERLKVNTAEILGLARREFEDLGEVFKKFALQEATTNTVKEFLFHMHPETGTGNAGPGNKRELLYNEIANGELTDSNELTIWDLFNGATKITNYKRTNSRLDDTVQFDYALNGTGANYSNQAYNFLLEKV